MPRVEYQQVQRGNLDAAGAVCPVVLGLIIGAVFVKSLAHLPTELFTQFTWGSSLVWRFVLSAAAGGWLVNSVLCLSGGKVRNRLNNSRFSRNGIVSVLLGAALFGFGMACSGGAPDTAWVQAGTGITSGYYLFLGCLLGVVAYGFLHKIALEKFEMLGRLKQDFVDDAVGGKCEYWHVALPLAVASYGFLFWLEFYSNQPWQSDLPYGASTSSSWIPRLKDTAWNPYILGLVYAGVHAAIRETIGGCIDGITSFTSLVCVPLKLVFDAIDCRLPDWIRHRGATMPLWQAILMGCAALGAYFTALMSGTLHPEEGFGWAWSLGGGFALVAGALLMGEGSVLFHSSITDLSLSGMVGVVASYGFAMLFTTLLANKGNHPERGDTVWARW